MPHLLRKSSCRRDQKLTEAYRYFKNVLPSTTTAATSNARLLFSALLGGVGWGGGGGGLKNVAATTLSPGLYVLQQDDSEGMTLYRVYIHVSMALLKSLHICQRAGEDEGIEGSSRLPAIIYYALLPSYNKQEKIEEKC
jgi:hypothetical protein